MMDAAVDEKEIDSGNFPLLGHDGHAGNGKRPVARVVDYDQVVHPCRDPEHRVAQQASAGVFCGKAAGLRPVKAYPACRPRACRSGDFQGRGQTAH